MYVPKQEFLHPSQEYLDEVEKLSDFQNGQIPLLESIDKNVSDINLKIANETDERKLADEATLKFTKKWNRINLFVAILAILISLGSVAISFIL